MDQELDERDVVGTRHDARESSRVQPIQSFPVNTEAQRTCCSNRLLMRGNNKAMYKGRLSVKGTKTACFRQKQIAA